MMYVRTLAAIVLLLSPLTLINAQVMINEGSNRNYSMLADEDGEFPDWIELYNSGSDTVNLIGYALTDDEDVPAKWVFPNTKLAPGEYRIIYCSGKDRKPLTAFNTVANSGTFTPVTGWNSHAFDNPFYWDGVSNVLVNICSYSSLGYTSNSVFNQSQLPFYATTMAWQDGSEASCSSHYGFKSNFRPNVKLDNHTIGEATNQNSPFDYPAPYGNWYWCSRTQFLITASEMSAADMSAGNIDSLSFDVVSTDANTVYDYIEISLKLVGKPEVTNEFEVLNSTINLHTNFKLAKKGETVYLFNPEGQLVSHLDVNCVNLDSSVGSLPDGSTHEALFSESTPEQTNNSSAENIGYLNAPLIETPAGLYNSVVKVNLTNPNEIPSTLYYTLDGSDPDVNSAVYDGTPITIYYSAVLKARVLADQVMPSPVSSASYLLGINHTTPILSVVTDRNNLFGPDGIFDHWDLEVEKEAHVEYYDTDHQLVFSKVAGMQVDGGLGGSRASPQHSFRIDFDHPVLGDKAIDYSFISTKPNHKTYSSIYLRNGSNQYLTYPYKDACAVEAMGEGTHNYYAGYTPVTVYINGTYFGLYELREKFNDDFYEAYDGADPDSMDLLSQSAYYFFVLRALKGSVDPFYAAVDSVKAIDPADSVFWDKADRFFDLTYYTDYIIAQSWIGNTDWPGNNIKIYRSDKTGFRWRFGIQDFELALEPNSWTNAAFNSIDFLQMQDGNNPYISLWQRGMQNERFRKYFINRFADLMNTNYKPEKLLAIENRMFEQTVLEMPKEYGRWGDANNVAGQMDKFIQNHYIYRAELSQRSEQVRNYIQSNLSLAGQVDVTLTTNPPGAGYIQINTIIPETLPWTGVYFNGNPVQITTTANPGYKFLYWAPNAVMPDPDTNATVEWNVTENTEFKAVFESTAEAGKLSFSELNYNSDSTRNSSNWIEIHNYGDAPINISGYSFTDSNVSHKFTLPNGTILQPDDRIVLVQDVTQFHTHFPGLPALGPLNFGFSNTSETLTLKNVANQVVLSFTYLDSIPWPKAADGYGPTLELVNDESDPTLPTSWFPGCIGGSPTQPYSPCSERIVFSEINYHSSPTADAGDWAELHNISTTQVNISHWAFKDGNPAHQYMLPANTILQPNAYLVLYSDFALFHARFPDVTNILGPFPFSLKNSSEAIRLFDAQGRLYQVVAYSDVDPWPVAADGSGYTLELISNTGIMSDGHNWSIGCFEGSPGTGFALPCVTTSLDNPEQHLQVRIDPNPSSGALTLSWDQASFPGHMAEMELYTSLGQLAWSKKDLHPHEKLDLSKEPDGMYYYRIKCGSRYAFGKLILEK